MVVYTWNALVHCDLFLLFANSLSLLCAVSLCLATIGNIEWVSRAYIQDNTTRIQLPMCWLPLSHVGRTYMLHMSHSSTLQIANGGQNVGFAHDDQHVLLDTIQHCTQWTFRHSLHSTNSWESIYDSTFKHWYLSTRQTFLCSVPRFAETPSDSRCTMGVSHST